MLGLIRSDPSRLAPRQSVVQTATSDRRTFKQGNDMRVLVRYAGLRPEQEQRARIAAGALAANSISAEAGPWDGTRCAMVLVNRDDGYGHHVQKIATRRGVPILALSREALHEPGVAWVSDESSAGALARAMLELLAVPAETETAATPAPGTRAPDASRPTEPAAARLPIDSALARLLHDPALRDKDLEAHIGGRTLLLRRSAGRVLTTSLSDQITARNRIGESGWAFRVLASASSVPPGFETSASLDAFLLLGALHSAAHLPPFPYASSSLRDWPDLGTIPESVSALRVAQALQAGCHDTASIAAFTALPAPQVSACLWAFGAAGLLEPQAGLSARSVPAVARPASGLFARLAAHFGLSRA